MSQDFVSMATGIGTFTNGTLSVLATAAAGSALSVKAAIGGCNGLNFAWQLLDGTTVKQQGYGLASADAGFAGDGDGLLMSEGGTIGVKVIPVAGTSTCVGNLQFRVIGPNR